ncbi:MAG: PQQ-binding-like beta-propeller repeat protein [Aureispira sp.]
MNWRPLLLSLIIFFTVMSLGVLTHLYLASKPNIPPAPTLLTNDQGRDSSTTLTFPDAHIGNFLQDDSSYYHIRVLNSTFLHKPSRNYYGDTAPSHLQTIWKLFLGKGTTKVGAVEKTWKGAGWTGQPLLVVENGQKYLLQGAYDHHLKKIEAATGKVVWQYKFDDVIKGTGSIWINHQADSLEDFALILQGSRAGKSLYATTVPSFRAISLLTGRDRWQLNSVQTHSYSRDVDASALLWNDTAYIGLENSIFTLLNPDPQQATLRQGLQQPQIYRQQDTLYQAVDRITHQRNLVTEASPTLLGKRVYISSGAGRVWGYHLEKDSLDWMYFTGADMDGTPVVTADSCLLITVEKQYITGRGGVLKLDPSLPPQQAAQWYFPTSDFEFASWQGGVVGSVAVNCHYKQEGEPNMAAFVGIDGMLYVVDTDTLVDDFSMPTFDTSLYLPCPQLLFKHYVGPSIATPIWVGKQLIVATSKGISRFEWQAAGHTFIFKEKIAIRCESTPVVDQGRLYIASRNGYLYCLGKVDSSQITTPIITPSQ